MVDLVQWLTACLDADERIARAATPGPWEQAPERVGWLASDEYWSVVDCSGTPAARENAEHVAVWDPARVLREIDAKRKLLARGGPFCTSGCDEPGNEPMNPDTNWTTPLEHHLDCAAYQAAGVLALPYADRPGFREEWAL